MPSNYSGVISFNPSLSLMTGGDRRTAQSVRVPLERLLDNDVYLQSVSDNISSRTTLLERMVDVSSVGALVTQTANTTALPLLNTQIPAYEATVGTRYRYFGQMQVARGATATATNISLRLTVGGTQVVLAVAALNTVPGYTGTVRIEGEISFHSAPGAAAAFTVTGVVHSTVASSTVAVELITPSLVLVADTTAPVDVVMLGFMSAATAGVSFTPVSSGLHRVKP